jgi:hypothetical protein
MICPRGCGSIPAGLDREFVRTERRETRAAPTPSPYLSVQRVRVLVAFFATGRGFCRRFRTQRPFTQIAEMSSSSLELDHQIGKNFCLSRPHLAHPSAWW